MSYILSVDGIAVAHAHWRHAWLSLRQRSSTRSSLLLSSSPTGSASDFSKSRHCTSRARFPLETFTMTAVVDDTTKRPSDEVAAPETAAKKHKTEDNDKLAATRAYGKLILFGEHFVVYKAPALVGAVAAYTDCAMEFTDNEGVEIIDNRPAVPNYKTKKAEEGQKAVELVLKHLNVDKGVKLTFGGDLCCVSGIGASAAQTVSLARAIAQTVPLDLTEEEINAAGYEGKI